MSETCDTTVGQVDVCSLCYHKRPCSCPLSVPPTEEMSMGPAAMGPCWWEWSVLPLRAM